MNVSFEPWLSQITWGQSSIIVPYIRASINEWKICPLIYAVPFKEYIET